MKAIQLLMALGSLLALSAIAQADTEANDFLATFPGGAKQYCNFVNQLLHRPETNTSCGVVIVLLESPENLDAIAKGEFGQVYTRFRLRKDVSFADASRNGEFTRIPVPPHSNILLIGTVLTIEQLESLRADPRIFQMALDLPMGPTGGVTSAGGGK